MLRDGHNNLKFSRGLSPVAATTDNTAYVSQIIDTANFMTCEFVILLGSLADADTTLTILVEDGNQSNLSDNATVDASYLIGTSAGAGIQFDSDNKVAKIGYVGPKRYVRVTITPANNTGNIFLAGVWVQGQPRKRPQSTQLV